MPGIRFFLRRCAATLLGASLLLIVALPVSAGLFNPQTFTLSNGMQVVVVTDRRAPVVYHMVWYKVGAADEPVGKSGIAHLFEHLMFKGTKQVGPGEFSKIVARNGGRENAFTSYDFTAYFQTVARDKLELVMRLEADRMANLVLTDEAVLPEVQVVLEERRSRTDNEPTALFQEQMAAVQFLSHPYGIPVIGWQHELERLTAEDARAFYKKYYAPNNAVLVVAGDISAEELKPLAEKYYGVVPRRPVPQRLRSQEPPQIAARRVDMEHPQVRQPSWSRSYLAPSRSAGETKYAVPLELLTEILGGGATSRLYRSLVVDGKQAVSAGAYYDSTSLDQTRFYIYVTPAQGTDVETVETSVDRVLADLVRDGVTTEELERARNGMLADAVYARDSLGTATRVFGQALTTGLTVKDIEDWPDKVRAVTAEEVVAAARYVLDMRRSVTGTLKPQPAS